VHQPDRLHPHGLQGLDLDYIGVIIGEDVVVRDGEPVTQEAKLWLDPVNIARAGSFSPTELRRIERIIEENRYALLEQWDASFGV
jgi:DUF2075 family protein